MKLLRSVCVYWGPREESAEACAQRLRSYFDEIECEFPALNRWYEVGIPKKRQGSVGCASDYDLVRLTRLVAKGVNRYDVPPREIIKDLGFRIPLYDRRRGDTCTGLGIHCGCYSRWTTNSVVLNVASEPSASGLDREDVIEKIFDIGVKVWNAETGMAFLQHELDPIVERRFSSKLVSSRGWP